MKTAVLCIEKARLEQALVAPTDTLGKAGVYEANLRSISADSYHFIARRVVDEPEVGLHNTIGQALPQLLAYVILKDEHDCYLSYSRGTTGGESRLANQRSIGVGGHTDIADVVFDNDGFIDAIATLEVAMMRELTEEVGKCLARNVAESLPDTIKIIVDPTDEASKVHIGVLVELSVKRDWIGNSSEIKDPQWVSKENLQVNIGQYEPWSNLTIQAL